MKTGDYVRTEEGIAKYLGKGKEQDIIEYKGKKYEEVKQHNFMVGSFVEELKDYDKVLFLKEHKEEILDKTEKEYLENVIRPFRNRIDNITKMKRIYLSTDRFYILIHFKSGHDMPFPIFYNKKMYKGMVDNQPYKLEELDLFKEEEK